MKTRLNLVLAGLFLASAVSAFAATRYVDASSTNATPPYTNWTTAARIIQDAVDAAVAGDEIVVTNGLYATGGRAVGTNVLVNRVTVDKPLAVRSVNGPEGTIIQGYQVPGTTNGDGAIRCVYLANGASLSGFTLTNGATRGGYELSWTDRCAGGVWCQSAAAVVSNCVVAGCSANFCGGGVSGGTVSNCKLIGNSTSYMGGGTYDGTLNGCILTGNSANWGGAAYSATLNHCLLSGNSAGNGGGGAWDCQLNNCTVTLNSASYAGGIYGEREQRGANNCIIYFNAAPSAANYLSDYSPLNYCCTTPLPTKGVGNITADPQLASASHLSADSPCRRAGSPAYTTGTDIDGEAWANPPSIGCDEFHAGAATGPLNVSISANYSNVTTGFSVEVTAMIEGQTSASKWDFGDGVVVSNRPFATHAWAAAGDYMVLLRAYNESHPEGVSASLTIRVVDDIHHVAADSTNPKPPYTSWATAASTIQDAVDVSMPGALVLVTNGTYALGARTITDTGPSRVAVNRPISLRSVNGPQLTVIDGSGTVRCVYLANGACLSGFTLTNGAATSGGGVLGESVLAVATNCTLAGNQAYGLGGGSAIATLENCRLIGNSASSGGGAWNGSLNSCKLTGNSASEAGGGAYGDVFFVVLNNCTLTGNSARYGGGVAMGDFGSAVLTNCIVYFNTALEGGNNYSGGSLNYCCTTPAPQGGVGNITSDPQLASAIYLSANSPCRGAGGAAYVSGTDIDGEPWVNPPSIGCDEYHLEAMTGPLSVSVVAGLTNLAVGFPASVTALIEGRATASSWNFGDGVAVTNRPFATHAWLTPGDYMITAWAYNESNPGGVSTTVSVHVVEQPVHYVSASSTDPLPPYTSWGTAATNIQDAVDVVTMPGALVLVTNGLYASGGRAGNRVAVDKPLEVRSVNGPEVTMISGWRGTTNFSDAIRCVYLANGASLFGFTLTNGGASYGGGVSCESEAATVYNCLVAGNSGYQGGGAYSGTLVNCTLSTNTATDVGGGVARGMLNNCTLNGNSSPGGGSDYYRGYGGGAYSGTLVNCTLTGNSARLGGGAYGGTMNACTLSGNSARVGGAATHSTLSQCVLTGNHAQWDGGGTLSGTLNNCTLIGNSAGDSGGGAYNGTLNNCTLVGNSATYYGGGFDGRDSGTLNNCIAYCNTAGSAGNNWSSVYFSGTFNHCCTTPMPTNGIGNFTNAPLFVDYAGGNLRLQSNSPCINAGNNASALGTTDLDGNPRIVSSTVDIGAYEFQGPGSVISYAWLQQFGLPTDGSADFSDADCDGHTLWQEWRCQTCPTNALSVLHLLSASKVGNDVTVSWQSMPGVYYFLERSTSLSASPTFTPLANGIPGQPGVTSFTDTNAAFLAPLFYRVGVP